MKNVEKTRAHKIVKDTTDLIVKTAKAATKTKPNMDSDLFSFDLDNTKPGKQTLKTEVKIDSNKIKNADKEKVKDLKKLGKAKKKAGTDRKVSVTKSKKTKKEKQLNK